MKKRLHLIQLSRALVPLFVLVFHAKAFMNHYFQYDFLGLSNVMKSGGVYYFFALSGFMVFYLHHRDFGNKKKIKSYFFNRFIRIYPVYWIITLLILPLYFLIPGLVDGNETKLVNIVASFLLFPIEDEPLLGVAWSLVHTVFFYIVFSLIFISNRYIVRTLFSGWAIVTILVNINIINTENYLFNFMFNFNSLIFLGGIACAYIILKRNINKHISWALFIIGLLIFPFSWINLQFEYFAVPFELLIMLASFMLILGCGSLDLQTNLKIPKSVSYLGDASLSIYLMHYSVMSALSLVLNMTVASLIPNIIITFLLIISGFVGGCLVYSLIEKPIHKKFKEFYNRKTNEKSNREIVINKHSDSVYR